MSEKIEQEIQQTDYIGIAAAVASVITFMCTAFIFYRLGFGFKSN